MRFFPQSPLLRLLPLCLGSAMACLGADLPVQSPPPPLPAPAVPPPAKVPATTPAPKADDFGKPPLPLTLRVCLERAFESNLDLLIDRLGPLEARANTLTARGVFDPSFNLSGSYGEQTTPNVGAFDTQSHSTSAATSLSQFLATGTTVALTGNTGGAATDTNGFQAPWESFAGATVSQSLLRNFGTDPNMAPIRIARHGESAADAALEYQVDAVITAVADAYYELVYARASYDALQESVHLAEKLLSDTKARVKIGIMIPLDVTTANAEVAARREDLLSAARLIESDENSLRLLIAKDVTPLLKNRLVPTDLPPVDWEPAPVPADIADALRGRADLRNARELLAQNRLSEAYRKNQLLPQLGVNGALGYGGASTDLSSSVGRVFDTSDPAWSVGMTLSIPLGNRAEKGQYQYAQYETVKQQLILRQLEQNVIIQTDNAGGEAETNRQQITATRAARQLAEESLKAEERKLAEGRSTNYVVLQLQDQLHTARIKELRAVADFQKSVAELMRVEGAARSHFNIELRGAAY